MTQLSTHWKKQISARWLFASGLVLLGAWVAWGAVQGGWIRVFYQLSIFSTVLLSIFIEAAPFLLLGCLGSAVIEVFFKPEDIRQALPKRLLPGALVGAVLGLFFPVSEGGSVPMARRLIQKGAPASVAVAFLLGAPVLNPLVIASTYVAFGWGPIFWGRIVITLLIATITGAVFGLQKETLVLFKQVTLDATAPAELEETPVVDGPVPLSRKASRTLDITVEEFFDIGRFLVLGASLAGILQSLIPQAILFSTGRGPVSSVLALIAQAMLLSGSSTTDAFVAQPFAGALTTGTLLAFLVFGPVVDMKSIFLYLHVFRGRYVLYLILFPLLLTVLIAIFINLNLYI